MLVSRYTGYTGSGIRIVFALLKISVILAQSLFAPSLMKFHRFQGNTEGSIIFYQCRMQEIIALLRTIATESFLYAHFCYSLRHCINNTFCQRQGNVANTQADNLFVRMCLSISAYLVRNISKSSLLSCNSFRLQMPLNNPHY